MFLLFSFQYTIFVVYLIQTSRYAASAAQTIREERWFCVLRCEALDFLRQRLPDALENLFTLKIGDMTANLFHVQYI